MAHDVFICHSSKDKIAADAACAVLERRGLRCWIAPRDAEPGKSWAAAIVQAINSSRVMLLVFSRNANESPQIEREVERAINQRIPVVTFRIEDIAPTEALEYFISADHWLDAFTLPISRQYEVLANRIDALLDRPDAKVAQPPIVDPVRPADPQPRSVGRWPLWLGLAALVIGAVLMGVWLSPRLAARQVAVQSAGAAAPSEQPASSSTTASRAGRGPVVAWSYPVNLDPNGDYWLALRSEPSVSTGVRLAKLGPDTLFRVEERSGEWTKVELADGRTGWVASQYVGCCRSSDGYANGY
jgi:hypothetical protein